MKADRLQQRLQGPLTGELVRLVADWILDRPLHRLIDVPFVVDQVMTGLEMASQGEQHEAWVKTQVHALRGQVPAGSPRDQIPEELIGAIEGVITRHYTPDKALVVALIDHPTMEALVRDLLSTALRNFVQQLKNLTPAMPKTPPRAGRGLGRLGSIGQSVLGGLGSEISQRAEHLANQTVDEALRRAIGQVSGHICDPAHADHYSAFRLHIWQTLIQTKNEALAAEWDKLDPDSLVAAGTAASRALAGRESLRAEIQRGVESVLESAGDRCLRDLLEETGLEDDNPAWRQAMEAQLALQIQDFVATAGFAAWLSRLLEED